MLGVVRGDDDMIWTLASCPPASGTPIIVPGASWAVDFAGGLIETACGRISRRGAPWRSARDARRTRPGACDDGLRALWRRVLAGPATTQRLPVQSYRPRPMWRIPLCQFVRAHAGSTGAVTPPSPDIVLVYNKAVGPH